MRAGCILETKDWRVRGVDIGHSSVNVRTPDYVQLPSFNLTFPSREEDTLKEQLRSDSPDRVGSCDPSLFPMYLVKL